VNVYYEGGLIEIKHAPGWEAYERPAAKRGKIKGFTRKSRARLMFFIACIKRNAKLPLFVTLTYPAEWPGDWSVWKEELNVFGQWIRDTYPKAGFIWKLEPQLRGAPHFHLLLWGIDYLPRVILAQRWYEIVGSGDPKHLRAGTRVERVESFNGVCHYASKYIGKIITGEFEYVGRFWGIIGKANIPKSACETAYVPARVAVWMRRLMRRSLAAKGIKVRAGRTFRLFTTAFDQWLRAGELCCDLAVLYPKRKLTTVPSRPPSDTISHSAPQLSLQTNEAARQPLINGEAVEQPNTNPVGAGCRKHDTGSGAGFLRFNGGFSGSLKSSELERSDSIFVARLRTAGRSLCR
jgi:hypothetical protein